MSNIVKIDLEQYQIEPSKAKQIQTTFEPMVKMLDEFEAQCNEIFTEATNGITAEVSAKAKRTRLDIAKVRISADKARKEMKDEYLRAGNAIQGAYNILAWAVQDRENKLKEIEDHQLRIEQERLEKLQSERAEQLAPYVEDAQERNLSGMDDDVWTAYFESKKKAYEDMIEAERLAEIARIEAELIAERSRVRELELAKYSDFVELTETVLGELEQSDFDKLLADAKAKKVAHEQEQAKIKAERERLEAEAKKREAQIEAERKKAEADKLKAQQEADKAKKIRLEKAETELKKLGFEKDNHGYIHKMHSHFIGANHYNDFDSDKELDFFVLNTAKSVSLKNAEAQLKAKADAEAKAEAGRLAEIARQKAEADKLAKAPIKKQLSAWVESFEIPSTEIKHDKKDEIVAKFNAFKTWALTEINKI